MDIIKKPYEISLWDDVLTYIWSSGNSIIETETAKKPSSSVTLTSTYYKEKRLCIIGSDTMDAPIRAVEPKFVSKINGENILTFSVYSQYWDPQFDRLFWNPFMQYLTNERKVKLKYEGKWYDFIIKNIEEDSSSKKFTYTCKDLFINELSKTGFELEFDNELENNMGTLQELASRILEGSDWRLKDDVETVLQYLEEPLYEAVFNTEEFLPSGLKVKNSYSSKGYDQQLSLPYGKKVYVFYSNVGNKTPTLTFLYKESGLYQVNDKNVIIGYSKDATDGAFNLYLENISWTNEGIPQIVKNNNAYNLFSSFNFIPTLRGERLVKSQKTTFDSKLNKTVKIYLDGERQVYGYEDVEYISPAAIQSYITNNSNFTSTTGWYVGKKNSDEPFPTLELVVYPELTDQTLEEYDGKTYLMFDPSGYAGQSLMNTGIQDNRSSIKSFTKDEQYILDLIVYKNLTSKSIPTTREISFKIFEYELKDGVYSRVEGKQDLFSITRESQEGDEIRKCICTCNYSISEKELKNTKIGIFIQNDVKDVDFYIEKLEFYPRKFYIDTQGNQKECAPGTLIDAQIKTQYCYYDPTSNYTNENDLEYLYKDSNPNQSYVPYYGAANTEEAYEKVRSLVAKESNRFNLLQALCELFQNWIKFEIDHEEDGTISLDENGIQKKWVTYKKYIGQDNHIGFKYGINLKSIKRSLDSNGSISKLIVKDNANEYAKNGFCSITRADENPSGENVIYNFDYYIGQGLLDFSSVNNDLYIDSDEAYLGYYPKINEINNRAHEHAEILSRLIVDIAVYTSQYQTYKIMAESAASDKAEQELKFRELTGVEFSKSLPEYQPYEPRKHGWKDEEDWWKDETLSWEFYIKNADGEYEKTDKKPVTDTQTKYYARLKWWDNNETKKIYASIVNDVSVEKESKENSEKQLELKQAAETQKSDIEKELKEIRTEKTQINLEFYKKYSRFIQEGYWISEDYFDDNLYYIDALSTLYTSSRPQIKYTIDVVELSLLPEYSDFNFNLGDRTYIEDKEFFGWAYDGSERLYREKVVVSETDVYFDSPEQNKIVVQNYKTQFDDLFQRVAAATQQIQLSVGEYKRASGIVNLNGTINSTVLQNSLASNSIVLQNIQDQSVIINEEGITTINLASPSEKLRIVSGGVFLTQDGGETWTTGITAQGINANSITSGSLNAAEINITMGSVSAMRWDRLGISSFKRNENGIDPGVFTRFDQFGIYGLNGTDNNYDPLEGVDTWDKAMDKLRQDASFGLTWKGFWLKSDGEEGYISISSDKDFEVIRTNTNEETGEQTQIPIIQIGRLMAEDSNYYGIRINDLEGNSVLETNQNGELWLKQKLSVQTNDPSNTVEIGALGSDPDYSSAKMVINASDKFKVYEDGHVEGTNAHFSGGSTFSGVINATGGQIGGLTIEEWKEMGYSVEITSSNGIILKGESSTVLTATLYKGNTACLGDTTEMTDDSGKIKTYKINYQWKKNGVDVGDGTKQNLDVSLTEEDTTIVYECVITLTEVSNE